MIRHLLLLDQQNRNPGTGASAAAVWVEHREAPTISEAGADVQEEFSGDQVSCADCGGSADTQAGDYVELSGNAGVHTHQPTGASTGGAVSSRVKRVRVSVPAGGTKHAAQTWLRIDKLGNTDMVSTDKHKLALKLGVQPRDLRLLDPAMASVSPPAILDRDRAIVVNLGAVKCIITLEYVLIVNPEDDNAASLIDTLKEKLSNPMHKGKVMSYPGLSRISTINRRLQPQGHVIGLSFELKVLEICLDIAVGILDVEAKEIERKIVPTLDSLTRRVKTQELELLRRNKNRLTRLTKRIETVKEVLEKFLQDDEDMHKLNLTAQEFTRQSALAQELSFIADPGAVGGYTPRISRSMSRRPSRRTGSGSSSSSSGSSHSGMNFEDDAEVAEVEMLLEAYQMHLDHLYNKLQTLDQFVEDAEDLVNVSLDTHRNRIIAVDIMLTAVLTALGIGTAVSGLFGMNMEYQTLLKDETYTFRLVAIIGSVSLPMAVMGMFVLWAIYTGAVTFSRV